MLFNPFSSILRRKFLSELLFPTTRCSNFVVSNLLRPRQYRTLYAKKRFNYDLDKLMKNAESNAKFLLERGKPMFLNTVDRSAALKMLYEQIQQKYYGIRKPLSAVTGSPGTGKTYFTALAVNKVKPNTFDDDNSCLPDILDLDSKAEEANYLPIYITFNDATSIDVEREGTQVGNLFRNRILYWLFSKFDDPIYPLFLENVIQKRTLPSLSALAAILQSAKIKVVYFVDELKHLEVLPGSDPSACLTDFVRSIGYESSDTYIFASSLISEDFKKFATKNKRLVQEIPVKLISSFDALLSPVIKSDLALGLFLQNEDNLRMMRIFLWGCLGQPRLFSSIIPTIVNDESFFRNQSTLQVYEKLKIQVTSLLEQIMIRHIDVQIIAAAFCQGQFNNMQEKMEEVLFQNFSASLVKNSQGRTHPLISPFYMEYLCTIPSEIHQNDDEFKFLTYLKDVMSYLKEWTAKVIESPENHGYSFEGFAPLWLRAYLASFMVCYQRNTFKTKDIFPGMVGSSKIIETFKKVTLQPRIKITKHGKYNFIEPEDYINAQSDSMVTISNNVVDKKSDYQDLFENGRLIVICQERNPGCDAFFRMITPDGKAVTLYIDCKYRLPRTKDGKLLSLEEARRKHELLESENFNGDLESMGKHALMFFTLNDFKESEPEIKDASFPIIVFSRRTILELMGPSLGFILPLQGTIDHGVPKNYFIH